MQEIPHVADTLEFDKHLYFRTLHPIYDPHLRHNLLGERVCSREVAGDGLGTGPARARGDIKDTLPFEWPPLVISPAYDLSLT